MPLLWLDTNVARSVKDLRSLARLAHNKHVTVVVHPQVYLERRRQRQVECAEEGSVFDSALFDNFLEKFGIQVFEMNLGRSTASQWADTLFQRYPTHGAWEAAKKATLGGELKQGFKVEPGQMPMTTDWLVALEVEHDADSVIVTEDRGEEWKALREGQPERILSLNEAFGWLQSRPSL